MDNGMDNMLDMYLFQFPERRTVKRQLRFQFRNLCAAPSGHASAIGYQKRSHIPCLSYVFCKKRDNILLKPRRILPRILDEEQLRELLMRMNFDKAAGKCAWADKFSPIPFLISDSKEDR